MTKFYSIGAFPKVMGAIDGTLIPILAPAKEEHLYICRKGFMPSTRWQSVMQKCDSQTLWPSGMAADSHGNKTAGRMVAWGQRIRPTELPYDPLKP